MGFLKKFLRNAFGDGSIPMGTSSFAHLTEDEIEAHLGIARYGRFTLTEAVRPSYDLQVVPSEGYRHDCYRDEKNRTSIPVLMASVSQERLFDVFMDLLDPLGMVVDVVLETSHDPSTRGHNDLYRDHIDIPVLKSVLWEFEDLLVNDGCAGVAVLNPEVPLEVQFDEHKLLIVYGDRLQPFEAVLHSHGVALSETMHFITEAEHVHSSSDVYAQRFEELKTRLGIDDHFSPTPPADSTWC